MGSAPRGVVTCEVEDCTSIPERYRRLCDKHRRRFYKYGDPREGRAPFLRGVPFVERLESKVQVGEPGECWPWTGTLNDGGYGTISQGSRSLNAHRTYYEHKVGPIPDGMQLDHTCHNEAYDRGECDGGSSCLHRRCCNPAHLLPSTPGQNTRRGGSPTAVLARLRRGVTCPCGCSHAFDPTAAMVVAWDMPPGEG